MRILVVGGTGGFGSTIARILQNDGHAVTAAGRDQKRGAAFSAANSGIAFARLERDAITVADLTAYDLVVDAAGPFQGQDHALTRTAIAARVDLIDIADDRTFVHSTADLDKEARAAGVRIISGASSIPALSSAVAIELAADMTRVDMVEIAISASSQAAFGRSVLMAMMTSAGRKVERGDGSLGVAMTDPRRMRIKHQGRRRFERQVIEVDTPDHDGLPALLHGSPSVRFRAGSELTLHNLCIRVVAWLVHRGLLRNGATVLPLARIARLGARRWSDGRSAMTVDVCGIENGGRIHRHWSLVARDGSGPRIPCLAVPAIVEAIAKGDVPTGARSAAGLVTTKDILSRMPMESVTIESSRKSVTPMYARQVRRHHRLSPAVAAMHDVPMTTVATGRADIVRGRGLPAWMVATLFRFPPAGRDVPVTVTFERTEDGERWTRDFGGRRFHSILVETSRQIEERFGPFAFRFKLVERNGGIDMEPIGWRAFGLRMPKALMPDGLATEREIDGRFVFNVPIRIPLIGLVVHYAGWLEPRRRNG